MVRMLPQIVKKEIDDTHYYFVDGEFYPGVTTILDQACPTPFGLKQFLLNNTAESAEEIKTTAGDFGSKLHSAYEQLLNGIELNLKEDYPKTKEKKHLISFYEWFLGFEPTKVQTEQTVASLTYKYAGTLDLFCVKDGETWIIDFKTSNGIYWSHELQLTAYKQAFEEMHGIKIDHVAILRTGSKHKAGYEFKEITRSFDDFLNTYKIYLSLNGGAIPEPPLINVYPDTLKLEIKK